MVNYLILSGAVAAAALLIAVVGVSLNAAAQQGADNSQSPAFVYKLDRKYYNYENGVFHVRAGGGSAISPMTWYFPRVAEINVGDTVEWSNPTLVGEPHTITFALAEGSFVASESAFLIANDTQVTPANPAENADPVIIPGQNGTNIIIGANNRSLSPTVVGADGKVTYLPPNASYNMTGGEKYINSGWMWPKDQVPPGLAPINTFSVTFEKAGTYNYLCEFHPWMTGQVIVK